MFTYELLTASGSPRSAEHAVESGGVWERGSVGFTTVKLQPDSSTINSGQKLRKNQGQSEVVSAGKKKTSFTADKYRPAVRVRVREKASRVKNIKKGGGC